jgi:hypothetical protein
MTDSFSQSQNALFDEWGRMVRAARQDEAEVTGLAPYRTRLETSHEEALACRRLRDSLVIQTREVTRRLHQALAQGEDAASRMRYFVKGMYGRRSPKLIRYGIKIRKLRRPPRPPVPGGDLAG